MSVTDCTTFPLETLTDPQRRAFVQFMAARRDTRYNLHEPIWFALLLARERPATEITTLSPPPVNDPPAPPITAEEVADIFDLPAQQWSDHTLDVARTRWRFDLLPTQGEISEAYHRRLGCFLGYPSVDVEYYLTSGMERTQPVDLVAEGIFQPEEVAFTTFVPQGHDDSIDGYERAIEIGTANRTTIATLADDWNVPALEAYAEWLYQDALTDCLTNE